MQYFYTNNPNLFNIHYDDDIKTEQLSWIITTMSQHNNCIIQLENCIRITELTLKLVIER